MNKNILERAKAINTLFLRHFPGQEALQPIINVNGALVYANKDFTIYDNLFYISIVDKDGNIYHADNINGLRRL